MTAPATAPIGPSTTAPDTAPNAASPARSWAIAAEDISARESAALAIVFFIRAPRAATTPVSKIRPRPNDVVLMRGCNTVELSAEAQTKTRPNADRGWPWWSGSHEYSSAPPHPTHPIALQNRGKL